MEQFKRVDINNIETNYLIYNDGRCHSLTSVYVYFNKRDNGYITQVLKGKVLGVINFNIKTFEEIVLPYRNIRS